MSCKTRFKKQSIGENSSTKCNYRKLETLPCVPHIKIEHQRRPTPDVLCVPPSSSMYHLHVVLDSREMKSGDVRLCISIYWNIHQTQQLYHHSNTLILDVLICKIEILTLGILTFGINQYLSAEGFWFCKKINFRITLKASVSKFIRYLVTIILFSQMSGTGALCCGPSFSL